MARTYILLDEQAVAKVFPFGTTSASGEALVTINKGTAATSTVVLDVKGSQTIAGDLNLLGNLNITGVINETSVTNLAVSDLNITLNKGGSTAGAANAGLFIEGDSAAAIGKLLYDGSLTSKWKIGDGSTQVEIVTVSGAQTLTNKSISGSQISSAVANATLAATVTTNANLTGVITSVGNTTSIGSQTGTGSVFVVQDTPTLTTPIIGVATGTSLALSGALTTGVSSSADGQLVFKNATNANTQTFKGSAAGANITYILPATAPTAGQVLSSTAPSSGTATLSWADSGAATTINISDDTTTNASVYPTWVSGTSGSQSAKVSSTKVSFNPSTGALSATSFSGAGTGLTGTASSLTAGTVTTNANLTGDVTSVGNATTLAKYFRAATVTGDQDGVNKVYTIGAAVKADSEQVFVNGILLNPGSGNDYVISGTTVTFQAAMFAPAADAVIRIYGVY